MHGQFALRGVVPLTLLRSPPPRLTGRRGDHADYRLPARVDVDVDVFDRDPLLALPTMTVEGFEQRCIGAG